MMLVQAEAMEFDRPVEVDIAEAGLESIEMCHEIPRTRAQLSTDDLLYLAPEDGFDIGMDFEDLGDFQF